MWRVVVLLFMLAGFALGHQVNVEVNREKAVVIKLRYADGMPFSYEKYQIFSPENKDIPFATGRTDKNGRIVFIPDIKGVWTVKAFSQDGHGVVKKIEITESFVPDGQSNSSFNHLLKILAGTGIIFALFGITALLRRKR
ncbi:ABC transporter permease [Persephonella sp.]